MNRSKAIITIAIPAILVAAGLGYLLLPEREPSYQGKSLSAWFEEHDHSRKEAAQAILHIGTNGIPILLEWLLKNESMIPPTVERWMVKVFGRSLSKAPSGVFKNKYNQWALSGFRILGTNAAPVVPVLTALLDDPRIDDRTESKVELALVCIGKPALSTFMAAFTNQNPRIHERSVASLCVFGGFNGFNEVPKYDPDLMRSRTDVLKSLIPFLVTSLQHENSLVRGNSAYLLGFYCEQPDTVIPALITAVQGTNTDIRLNALRAIGNFKTNATLAVPLLTNLLAAPDSTLREAAAKALEKVVTDLGDKSRIQ